MALSTRRNFLRGVASLGLGLVGTAWNTRVAARDADMPGREALADEPLDLYIEILDESNAVLLRMQWTYGSEHQYAAYGSAFAGRLDSKYRLQMLGRHCTDHCCRFYYLVDCLDRSICIDTHVSGGSIDGGDTAGLPNKDVHLFIAQSFFVEYRYPVEKALPFEREVALFVKVVEDTVMQLLEIADLIQVTGQAALAEVAQRLRDVSSDQKIITLTHRDLFNR